jgi:ABC-type uncharacterized transport system ATPase subunit
MSRIELYVCILDPRRPAVKTSNPPGAWTGSYGITLSRNIQNLPQRRPGTKAVSLTIPTGMYGLLGFNGTGKSTLMRILAALQEPDTGSVTLGDIDVVRQKDEVRKTLAFPLFPVRCLRSVP